MARRNCCEDHDGRDPVRRSDAMRLVGIEDRKIQRPNHLQQVTEVSQRHIGKRDGETVLEPHYLSDTPATILGVVGYDCVRRSEDEKRDLLDEQPLGADEMSG